MPASRSVDAARRSLGLSDDHGHSVVEPVEDVTRFRRALSDDHGLLADAACARLAAIEALRGETSVDDDTAVMVVPYRSGEST